VTMAADQQPEPPVLRATVASAAWGTAFPGPRHPRGHL